MCSSRAMHEQRPHGSVAERQHSKGSQMGKVIAKQPGSFSKSMLKVTTKGGIQGQCISTHTCRENNGACEVYKDICCKNKNTSAYRNSISR